MKKLIFFSLLGLLFFGGCSITVPTSSQENVTINLTDIEGNAISYQVSSNIFPGSYTGIFQKSPLFADVPESEETKLMIGHGSMTGNMYTYNFPDIGMTFTFADIAASYFNPEDPGYFEPSMYYSGNTAFYKGQFVAVLSKDTGANLSDIIQKDHSLLIKDGCFPKLWEGNLTVFSGSEDYEIYDLEKNGSEACLLGTFFIMKKSSPEKYYLLSHADACAPSCNTFTHIELK